MAVEMLDYDFLDNCTDTAVLRAIVQKLRSGDEGHYPHLIKVRLCNGHRALLQEAFFSHPIHVKLSGLLDRT